MTGLNLSQYKELIVAPTLAILGQVEPELYSAAAINLLTGTMAVESNGLYLEQYPTGPAIGLDEIELATFNDLYGRYLNLNVPLLQKVNSFLFPALTPANQLHGNLYFSAAMARIKYLTSDRAIPVATDAVALAQYHHDVYNAGGKASVVTNTPIFKQAIEA